MLKLCHNYVRMKINYHYIILIEIFLAGILKLNHLNKINFKKYFK